MQQRDALNPSVESDGMDPDVFPTNNLPALKQSLAETDPGEILERLRNYSKLDTDQRVKVARTLSVLYEQLPAEERNFIQLKGLLMEIVKDKESISKALLYQLPEVEKMLAHHNNTQNEGQPEKHRENIKNILIPVLINYLNFPQLDVKEEAGKQLGCLAHQLTDNDRGDFVLKHVIEMAHDDANEENRIVAVQLFSSMSECFGRQLCEQFIGLQILSLGEDTSFKVRKEAIKHLPTICRLVSKQFFGRLFLFYQGKTKDQSNWALRKACVDIIIDMAEMCDSNERETILVDIMLVLLKDANKWVRVSAYKNLGKFIYSLKGLKISDKLVTQFCRMVENDVNSIGKDNQIIFSCAYNFPAVLNALGKDRWETDLWRVYERLLKNHDKKIKKTLSESLHEIAKIIGQELTEKYLFAVVDTFFKDKNDDIKLGTIRNMSGIMGVLSYEKRQSLIGVFEQFQKDQKKWRIRECIGKQLSCILEIYSPDTIFEYVVPILFKLCSDSVSIVRDEAAMKVGDFITKFQKQKEGEIFLPGIVESVKGFGSSPKYTQRQAFLVMCKKLMNHPEMFMKNFMEIMDEMKKDKVVNVKLLLAEIVKAHIDLKGPMCNEERLIALKNALKQDEDEEVRDVFEDQ